MREPNATQATGQIDVPYMNSLRQSAVVVFLAQTSGCRHGEYYPSKSINPGNQ